MDKTKPPNHKGPNMSGTIFYELSVSQSTNVSIRLPCILLHFKGIGPIYLQWPIVFHFGIHPETNGTVGSGSSVKSLVSLHVRLVSYKVEQVSVQDRVVVNVVSLGLNR